ncbi:MAG: riboflavin biosynthesis protein [Nitrospirales bacterium]|nr:MAG: riboflavin biosynthesis protein [Nitrospirales bacterium]
MRVIRDLRSFPRAPHPVVTIGNFDGQHVGHQALLAEVVEISRRHQGTPMVLTFDPHPAKVLSPGIALQYLTSQEEKFDFFERLGITELIILEFTKQLASVTPQEFAGTILRDGLGVREVVVGENFVFGSRRSGNIQKLAQLGVASNFQVHPVPPVHVEGAIVSSTRIRQLLQAGKVKEAAACLGRPYCLSEQVIHGEHRGEKIGWPTGNLRLAPDRVVPADGIYATMAHIQGEWMPSISYIGRRPTFVEGERLLEVHLFDQCRSLYGQRMHVSFIDYIRGDQQFVNVDELLRQMDRDAIHARRVLDVWNKDLAQHSRLTAFHSTSCS